MRAPTWPGHFLEADDGLTATTTAEQVADVSRLFKFSVMNSTTA